MCIRDRLATALLMTSGQMGWIKALGVGSEIGVEGVKLVFGVFVNLILGALQASGLGMYAPSMALVYLLGLSPKVAFPIMMASSAFALPSASIRYVKEKAYNRKASLAISLTGIVGVLIAAFIVKSLPIYILTWLVIAVILYASITLLIAGFKD